MYYTEDKGRKQSSKNKRVLLHYDMRKDFTTTQSSRSHICQLVSGFNSRYKFSGTRNMAKYAFIPFFFLMTHALRKRYSINGTTATPETTDERHQRDKKLKKGEKECA